MIAALVDNWSAAFHKYTYAWLFFQAGSEPSRPAQARLVAKAARHVDEDKKSKSFGFRLQVASDNSE